MKFKYIFLASAFLTLSFSSCEDAYRVDAKDEIIDTNAITNITHLRSAMNGVYIGISGSSMIEWSAFFTDEVRKPSSNRGSGVQVHTWSINTGTNEPQSYYSSLYGTINRANVVLQRLDALNLTVQSEIDEASKYRAELLAIRANAHFDLFRFFAQSYTDRNALAISIVEAPIVSEKYSRNTVGEVIDFINEDLELSYNELVRLSATNDNKTKITPSAVQAMRARVALYTKDYDNAIAYATDVTNVIPLAVGAEYTNVFKETLDSKEIIFKLKRATVGQGTLGTMFTDTNGDVLFNMSYDLYDNYMVSGDARNAVLLGSSQSYDNLLVGKYEGADPAQFGLADHKLFRVSEMYLILAEAYALKSAPDYTASTTALNAVRAARRLNTSALPNVSYNDVVGATSAILYERRLELAFEGHRFFDLRRFNLGVERLSDDIQLNDFAQSLPANDYRFVLPIPQAAIFANDNLVQNPGY